LILWDIRKNEEKEVIAERKRGGSNFRPISNLVFSPDGSTLAAGSGWGETLSDVPLWDVTRRSRPYSLQWQGFQVWSVAFSHDGKLLATAHEDKTLSIWDMTTRKNRTTMTGHAGPVSSVAFSPSDRILASGSDDGTVRIWDVNLCEQRAVLKGHNDHVTSVVFSSDGNILASASTDKSVILWQAAAPTEAER
jgi:WD40 repeat protein